MKKIFKFGVFIVMMIILLFFVAKTVYKAEYIDIISKECEKYNIDKFEILSLIKAESNFKPDAVSGKNAVGLMQLTPDTAVWCAEQLNIGEIDINDLYVPEINIKLGVFYYNYLKEKYKDFNTTLASYNAGMGNVNKWIKDSEYSDDGFTVKTTPFKETNRYITKINNNLKIYNFLYKELKI